MRRNKYGNRKTTCLSSHKHDSKKEASFCNVLLSMREDGEILDYETHKRIILLEGFRNAQGKKIRPITYTPDFVVYHDGRTEFIDVKGGRATQTATFRLKWKLLQHKYVSDPTYLFTIK